MSVCSLLKKALFISLLLWNFPNQVRSQNLVPDPGFTQVKNLQTTDFSINNLMSHWFSPNILSPGFITTLQMPLGYGGIANTPPSHYIPPFVGHSYLLLGMYSQDNNQRFLSPRSYASTRLNSSLSKGDLFHLKLNFHAHSGRGTLSNQFANNLGFVISDSLFYPNGENINLVPDYNIDTVLQPYYQWFSVDTCVIALRGGQFLTIGNFFSNANTIADHSTIYGAQAGIDNIYLARMQLALASGDTVYGCSNEPLVLEATNDCDYQWALKSHPTHILHKGPQFEVRPQVSTTYLVYGRTDTLEVHVKVDERIGLELGPNQKVCLGDTVSLNISHLRADAVRWSTGDTTDFLSISKPGWYSVMAARGNCVEYDSIFIAYDSLPEVTITNAQNADCLGALVTLDTYHQKDYQYRWSTGANTPTITTRTNDTYWVEVSNYCGIVADTLVLANEPCTCRIYIANSFAPESPNVENTKISPQGTCSFEDFVFTVFDRWGQKVFESNTLQQAWDGTLHNGQPAPAGVYTYTFFYRGYTEDGRLATETRNGTINLIR